jgi:hypothetical protein
MAGAILVVGRPGEIALAKPDWSMVFRQAEMGAGEKENPPPNTPNPSA